MCVSMAMRRTNVREARKSYIYDNKISIIEKNSTIFFFFLVAFQDNLKTITDITTNVNFFAYAF